MMIAMIALAKYTLIVDSGLTFTLFVYCWPISEDHTLYCAQSRSVRPGNVGELLCSIESLHLCEGLSYLPEVKDVALDPTSKDRIPGTILRHSVPKQLTDDEAVYGLDQLIVIS